VNLRKIAARMDRLYEFDRSPVTIDKFQNGFKFAGLFAGEHVAATEFVIGAFFVLHGVSFWDLIWGLLIGNLLAVLSWTLICAPIATGTRLTLYWYLRRIGGPGLTAIYNIANAILYCVLAGAMMSVAATAACLAFNISAPTLDDVLPTSVGWVLVVLAIGVTITVFAILGFEKVSSVSMICSPWLLAMFVAGAISQFPHLGMEVSLASVVEVAQSNIWNGVAVEGQEKFSLIHVLLFAWIANLAMHIGLSDMALLRYAPNWKYGLYSAFGMFPGHMLAWICSGVMMAAMGREMQPGLMAYQAAGLAGVLAVIIAGWTTANPTLYRVGLALQVVSPDWPRWKVTLAAGAVTTVLAVFPVFFMRLLDYVAIYGLILMPVGAIALAEYWLFPKLGLEGREAERRGLSFNWKVMLTWLTSLLLCALVPVHLYLRWLPGYLFALLFYTSLQWFGREQPVEQKGRIEKSVSGESI